MGSEWTKSKKKTKKKKKINKDAHIHSHSRFSNSFSGFDTLSNGHASWVAGRASVEASSEHPALENKLSVVKVASHEITHVTLSKPILEIALLHIAEEELQSPLGDLAHTLGNTLGADLALLKVALLDLSLIEESGSKLLLVEVAGEELVNVTLVKILALGEIAEEELQGSFCDLSDTLGDTLGGDLALLEVALLNVGVIEVSGSELLKVTLVELFQVTLIERIEVTEEEPKGPLGDLANTLGNTLGADLALLKVSLLKFVEITLIKLLEVALLDLLKVTEEQLQGALGDLSDTLGHTLGGDLALLKVTLIKLGLVKVPGNELLLVKVALNELLEVPLLKFINVTLFDVTEEEVHGALGNLANALGDTLEAELALLEVASSELLCLVTVASDEFVEVSLAELINVSLFDIAEEQFQGTLGDLANSLSNALGGDFTLLEVTSNKLLLVIIASDELLKVSLAEFINVSGFEVAKQELQGTLGDLSDALGNTLGGDLALLEVPLLVLGLGLRGESNAQLARLVGLLAGSSTSGVLGGLVMLSRLGNLVVARGQSSTELAALSSLVALASLMGGPDLGELLVGREGDAQLAAGGGFGSLHQCEIVGCLVDLEGETLAGEAEPDEGSEAELLGGDHCECVM
ncbi:unnamed protein product [Clonostachys byssicola]|uniref:Uncharacterized protein n=1 Tax=Clonostachys byssicola TaxID=160290 RepID=A0A9N9XZY0_9HYPO|nr:unnamed protein product [Clonostachys byssicola]